jgi:hypothetical protein
MFTSPTRYTYIHARTDTHTCQYTCTGAARDWPEGRGIFYNESKSVLCWCNEEDQCRIIAMENGGDVKCVFERFCALSDAIKVPCCIYENAYCVCICMNVYVCMYIYVHIVMSIMSSSAHMHSLLVYLCMCVYMRTNKHVHAKLMQRRMKDRSCSTAYVCRYIHTNTHTHTRLLPRRMASRSCTTRSWASWAHAPQTLALACDAASWYVCMYVCMYACMYVVRYVYTYLCVHVYLRVCMNS